MNLLKDKRGEGEGIYLVVPFILIFFFVVMPIITEKNAAVSMTIEGIITNIEISYATEDSTLITFNANETINFDDRIPNIIIGKSYIVNYLHYESGKNSITSIQSLRKNP